MWRYPSRPANSLNDQHVAVLKPRPRPLPIHRPAGPPRTILARRLGSPPRQFEFFLRGVPALSASQDTTRYAVTHHTEQDVMPEVQRCETSLNEAMVAALVYGINDPRPDPPHVTRPQIDAALAADHYDEFWRKFGLWDDLVKRGVTAEP